MRVTVIGTRIAGNTLGWTFHSPVESSSMTVELRPGGSHTASIDHIGTPSSVGIGFMVCAEPMASYRPTGSAIWSAPALVRRASVGHV